MSTDYAEKERSFIESLQADTGRDLAGWLDAIRASGLTDRNAIIDLLRMNGFVFTKASWLERIHNNGGRLIYASAATPPSGTSAPLAARGQTARAVKAGAPNSANAAVAQPSPAAAEPVSAGESAACPAAAAPTSGFSPEVGALLMGAKGLRPLAEHMLREICHALPQASFSCEGPLVMVSAPHPIAALLPQPRMLKLYAAFPAGAGRTEVADLVNKAPAPFPAMIQIDDVRLVDGAFRSLVAALAPPMRVQLRA